MPFAPLRRRTRSVPPVLLVALAAALVACAPPPPRAPLITYTYDVRGWGNTSNVEDFAARAAESFDALYSHCEGWPAGGATDIDAFKAYIRAHELAPDVYYRAYPRATVRDVKSALRLKEAWLALLDTLNE